VNTHGLEQRDRAWALRMLGAGANAALAGERHRFIIAEDGAAKALALWVASEGDTAFLGPVLVDPPGRHDLFNAAIVAVCQAGLDEGYTIGKTRVNDRRIVRLLERDFGVTFTPTARNAVAGPVVAWELTVHLSTIVTAAQRNGLV